jgi:hypothetical protein
MSRHFGTYRGKDIIIVGHNPHEDMCMIVKLDAVPLNDADELRSLSARNQSVYYMVPVLQCHSHSKVSEDWFTYLAARLMNNKGDVLSVPPSQITFEDPVQQEYYVQSIKALDYYMVLRDDEDAVVLVKAKFMCFHKETHMVTEWLDKEDSGRSVEDINEAEYGTYHAICDLPQIHITEFARWKRKYENGGKSPFWDSLRDTFM